MRGEKLQTGLSVPLSGSISSSSLGAFSICFFRVNEAWFGDFPFTRVSGNDRVRFLCLIRRDRNNHVSNSSVQEGGRQFRHDRIDYAFSLQAILVRRTMNVRSIRGQFLLPNASVNSALLRIILIRRTTIPSSPRRVLRYT